MIIRLCRILLLLSYLSAAFLPQTKVVSAQGGAKATLFSLQTDQFPQISAYLDVRDAQGRFVRGLKPEQITVIEDGSARKLDTFEPLEPGAQFVIAVNPGRSFAIRDGQGTSRYDLLVASLSAWAENRAPTPDDFSLLLDTRQEILHTSDSLDLARALSAYEDDFRDEEPDLEVLSHALEVLNSEPAREGMGSAILFITSPLDANFSLGLETITSQAVQRGIRISVWYISSTDFFSSRSYGLLQELAEQTAGNMFAFSGSENLPDPETYLDPLREVYRISYTSAISTAGEHPVYLEISHAGEKIASSTQSYFMEILPPNPILISPPARIFRVGTYKDSSFPDIDPDSQLLEILVEYPDGFPRQLVASFLYVNGNIVAENLEEPFDRFVWDLSRYLEDSTPLISIQVVDSLGLSGLSAEVPVEISVEVPRQSIWMVMVRHAPQLVLVVVAFSGAVLLLVLIAGGRIKPRGFGQLQNAAARPRFRTKKSYPTNFSSDPLTQPVRGIEPRQENPRKLTQWINRLHWPQRQAAAGAYAFLTRLAESDNSRAERPIPITDEEIRIGRDPYRVNMLLDDPSLEGMHASIIREGEGFRICDAGTTAGTWVNYSPVSREGILLEQGDIVHIGRIGFRFTLRKPGPQRKAAIIRQETSQ